MRGTLDVGLGISVLVVALGLGACGGSSAPRASTGSNENTTSSSPMKFACDPGRNDCTTADVVATVRQIYEVAGATAAESSCLAQISATGKHALSQAFNAFSDAQTRAAVHCVGSGARLQTIIDGLIRHFPGRGQPASTTPTSCAMATLPAGAIPAGFVIKQCGSIGGGNFSPSTTSPKTP